MKLSILICHLDQRKHLVVRLLSVLNPQLTPEVEILTDSTPGISIGAKRNQLLARATGQYVVFIDDDDLVSTNYVSLILQAIQNNPDVVDMEGIYTHNGQNPRPSGRLLA